MLYMSSLLLLALSAEAWISNPLTSGLARASLSTSGSSTSLFMDDYEDFEDEYNYIDDDYNMDDYNYEEFIWPSLSPSSKMQEDEEEDEEDVPREVRASVAGVSVSAETGFWVMLQMATTNDKDEIVSSLLPIQVTDDPLDRCAATSGQALTIVQLLSNVDMAGVILPPQVLAQLVIVALEEANNSHVADDGAIIGSVHEHWQFNLLHSVKDQVGELVSGKKADEDFDDEFSYTDASLWVRSRTKLPVCTLDQVHFNVVDESIDLDVVVRGEGEEQGNQRFILENLSEKTVSSVLQEEYRIGVSKNFMAIALALRYKAPITVTLPTANDDDDETIFYSEKELQAKFPLYTTVANLQRTSNRVFENIERGFEYQKLQAAYNIARNKQDFKAMAKIQEKLDEMDNNLINGMDDLPVQPESDMDSME